MANTNAPFGFRPVRRLDGVTPNFEFREFRIANANATVIAKGDFVKALNTGYITLSTAGTTDANLGVFQGCRYLSATTGKTEYSNYWPGSGATGDIIAQVIIDPNVVFEVQTTSTGPAVFADLWANFDLVAGTAANGFSKQALDYGSIGTTSTLPFKLVEIPGLYAPESSEIDATTAYNIVMVTLNHTVFHQGVTGL